MPIQHAALYGAVYQRMRDVLLKVEGRRGNTRKFVYRAASATFGGRSGADAQRTPFQSSTNDANRWTGPRPAPFASAKPAAGGIYTSLGMNDALLGEVSFYAFQTTVDEDVQRQLEGKPTLLTSGTFSTAIAQKRIFEYEFNPAMRIADLSLTSQAGLRLLREMDNDPSTRSALRAAGYVTAEAAYLASTDHSLPRAMSQAVCDFLPGFRAIWITSVRADSARMMHDDEGDNIVFLGPDNVLIAALTPTREISFTVGTRGVQHVVTKL